MHDLMFDTPEAYARRICYISDASTIRARTMDEFGRAPSLDRIREMQEARRKPMRDYGEEIGPQPKAEVADVPKPMPAPRKAITPREIVTEIARRFNLTYWDLVGDGKTKLVLRARYLAIAVLIHRQRAKSRQDDGLFSPVGRIMGGRDHSTIMNAWKRWPALLEKDPEVARVYAEFTSASKAKS